MANAGSDNSLNELILVIAEINKAENEHIPAIDNFYNGRNENILANVESDNSRNEPILVIAEINNVENELIPAIDNFDNGRNESILTIVESDKARNERIPAMDEIHHGWFVISALAVDFLVDSFVRIYYHSFWQPKKNNQPAGIMINLESLFVNWFEDTHITTTRLTIFARQHLLKVQADNTSGVYDDIVTATEPLLTALENELTDRTTKAGIEKGRVEAKELFRAQLPEKIRKLYSAVVVAYGDPSPDLTICFPNKRTVFGPSGCKDEDLNNHLEQLKNALTERAAVVGAAHVTTINSLCTQWSALYLNRWLADAATDQSASAQGLAFAALKAQLYKNVHAVAMNNMGNMEACNRLLPQAVLFPAQMQLPGVCIITVQSGIGQFGGTAQATGATMIHWYIRAAGSEGDWLEVGTSEPGVAATFSDITPASYEVKAAGENEKGLGPESEVATVEVT